MSDAWPWLAIAGLGLFHGLNPAMGWLFAVAVGLHRASQGLIVVALLPIALGHGLSVAALVALVLAFGLTVDGAGLRIVCGALLIGWAVYHGRWGHRHRVRVGMRASMAGLGLWSFLMATAHGAGLMLIPALIPLCLAASPGGALTARGSLEVSLAAVALHGGAMLLATAAMALAVYRWLGLDLLRRAWINVDRLWVAALAAAGAMVVAG